MQERIERVYTHDGPGFKAGTVDAAEYAAIRDRVHKTVPQDSLVGMLMDAPANLDLHVVHSSDRGIQQHSVFTWDVEGDDFAYVDGLTDGARFTDAVITHWLAGFSDEEAAMVVTHCSGARSVRRAERHRGAVGRREVNFPFERSGEEHRSRCA